MDLPKTNGVVTISYTSDRSPEDETLFHVSLYNKDEKGVTQFVAAAITPYLHTEFNVVPSGSYNCTVKRIMSMNDLDNEVTVPPFVPTSTYPMAGELQFIHPDQLLTSKHGSP